MKQNILFFTLFFLAIFNLKAGSITWTNTSGDGNWNTAANWSSATVPGINDIAIFDGTGEFSCNINTNVNVQGFQINAGYTQTITQNPGVTILVGVSHFIQSSGNFVGGNSNMTCTRNFTISGGVFTSTTATLQVARNFTFSGGTFNHNNGTFVSNMTNHVVYAGSPIFNNYTLTLSGGANRTFTNGAGDVITVNGTYTLSGLTRVTFNGGKVLCLGDINITNTGSAGSGSGTLEIGGGEAQSIVSTVTLDQGVLPNVIINKSGGTATFSGTISVAKDWTYTAGITDYATNNAEIAFVTFNQTINGVQTFENLTVRHKQSNGNWFINNDITVKGALTYSGVGTETNVSTQGPGIINCEGDINLNAARRFGGSGTINITGNANQTITSTVLLGQNALANVIINKSGGTATFAGTISVSKNWTYIAGLTDYATNNAEIAFVRFNQTISGVQTFENLTVRHTQSNGNWFINNDITVKGALTYSGLGSETDVRTQGPGIINCEGDINLDANRTGFGGSGTINITGNANQTITSTVTALRCEMPNIIINKSGGTATFVGTISLLKDWTYIAGTVDHSTNNSTIVFSNVNQAISGVQSFENLRIHFTGNGDLDVMNDITVDDLFTFSGVQKTDIDGPGIVSCKGGILITNTSTACIGNGTINITGNGNQLINGAKNISAGELPNVIINKTGGTATFQGLVSTARNWTYLAGVTDYSTNNSTIGFVEANHVITGVQTFHNIRLHFVNSGDWDVMNDITIAGQLWISNGGKTDIDGPGIVNCEGDILIQNTATSNRGNGTIRITGNGNQLINGAKNISAGELPHIIIDKSGGTATFQGLVSTTGNWTYIAGLTDYSTNNSTIGFLEGNHIITGVQTFDNIRLHFFSAGDWDVMNDITIEGELWVSGTSIIDIDGPGIVNCEGDMRLENSQINCAGNGTINITGAANQAIGGTSGIGRGELPNIIINKTGGTATFSNNFNFNGNFTYTLGVVDATTNNSRFVSYGANSLFDPEATDATVLTFHDLNLNVFTTGHSLLGSLKVNNILNLGSTRMSMNGNEVSLINPAGAALVNNSTNGMLISEATDNSAKINWSIGTNGNNHIYLFGNVAFTAIPFHFQVTDGGDVGVVTISTYPTVSNNTPFPVTPELVTHVNAADGSGGNSTNTIDRFWQIDKTGLAGSSELRFTYAQIDVSGGVTGNEGQLEAQRYQSSDSTWQTALVGQTQNTAVNFVNVPGVTTFSPWTLALNSSPLPITLIDFTAKAKNTQVDLKWITASEINNDFFTLEKSVDGINFTAFTEQPGAGNSNAIINYNDVDYKPYVGVSYYRLKQTDFNGDYAYSKIVAVNFESENNISIYPNPNKGVFTVDGDDVVAVKIYSTTGQLVYSKNHKGKIDISNQPKGIYFVEMHADNTVVRKKVIVE